MASSMRYQWQFIGIVLLLALAFVACLPLKQRRRASATDDLATSQQRLRRKVGNLSITSTPEQYIRDLYEEYVSESGRPRHGTDKPTDVWCFPDKDIAKESYRVKPVRTTKCTTYTQYVFQWSSIADQVEDDELIVQRGILRAYTQIINRHISPNETVNISITVVMVPRTETNSSNSSDWSEGMIAGEQVLEVGHGSDGWVELNITAGVQEIWPSMDNYTQVQVIIKAEVDCIGQKKVPFNFVNPAEIPLDQENRRTRHLDIQPLLVVFADNKETLAVLQQREKGVTGDNDDSNNTYRDFGDMLSYGADSAPKKRSTSDCSMSSYIVNLHALGLTNVVAPIEVNISKCSGSCTHRDTINNLGTNHAKIMNSIYHLEQLAMQTQPDAGHEITATLPCCVPTKYEIVYLIMNTLDGTATGLKSHNHLAATECGCR